MPIDHPSRQKFYTLFDPLLLTHFDGRNRENRALHVSLSPNPGERQPKHSGRQDTLDGVYMACLRESMIAMQFVCRPTFALCSGLC